MSETFAYATRLKNRKQLLKSSSGGVFTALSDVFLKAGNAVVCAVYNYESHQTEYRIVKDKEARDKALGSKYMQSIPYNIFIEAYYYLKTNPNKELLFVGTGCYAAGFEKFAKLKGIRHRITLVDIICHGCVSPLIWREYAEKLEKRNGNMVMSHLSFKDKRNGWNHPTAVAVIGQKEIKLDDYVRIFYNQCALRPSCHVCPYAAVERDTDITIGDYWGIEKSIPDFYDKCGNSLVLVHTERGKQLFDKASNDLEIMESCLADCMQPNLLRPTEQSALRENFWRDYHKKGISYVMKKNNIILLKSRLKTKMKQMFGRA